MLLSNLQLRLRQATITAVVLVGLLSPAQEMPKGQPQTQAPAVPGTPAITNVETPEDVKSLKELNERCIHEIETDPKSLSAECRRLIESTAPRIAGEFQQATAPPGVSEEAKNKFQGFVTSSLGYELPLFGANLFDNVPSTFAPIDRVSVPSDYVIGPGDELLIRAWGQLDIELNSTVDRSGNVYIPKVGNVSVAGVRYQELPDRLKSAIGRVFHDFEVTASLGQLRSISIFVVGQARRPGQYTVSSLSSLVNALFATGGPSVNGSLRHIQLKRGSTVVTELDLYELLLQGDKSKDAALQAGDVIFIPPVTDLAAVSGAVNNPAIYELKGKTDLSGLIALAGGLSTVAENGKITVERILEGKDRQVEQFEMDSAGLAHPAVNGDLVRVLDLSPRFKGTVSLRGNVARPGRYPWHAGMRVKDLIPDREALIVPEFWEQQNAQVGLPRKKKEREKDKDKDQQSNGDQGDSSSSESDKKEKGNEDSKSGEENIRTDVKRNAPDINWDYAVIERLNLEQLTTDLIPFNLGKAVLEGDPANNLELKPGDVVTTFSQADLRVPTAKQSKFVRLEGEFNAAGIYKIGPAETLRELVMQVGGFTANAYLFGAQFFRESSRTEQQERMNEFVDRLEADVERAATTLGSTGQGGVDEGQMRLRIENQRRVISNLRALKATGRIVLGMKPSSSVAEDIPDLLLEDGDVFVLPSRPSTVTVIGAVYNPNDLIFKNDETVHDYLKQSGGPTRSADSGRIYVIRADGSVRSKQGHSGWTGGEFENMRLSMGDTIVVPEQITKTAFITQLKDWTQVFANLALGVAAIHVLGN